MIKNKSELQFCQCLVYFNMNKSVVFVCMGNTCRSPMAEAIFRHLAKEKGIMDEWTMDSAAIIPRFVGEPPNEKTMQCLQRNGIVFNHVGRLLTQNDLDVFEHILVMDDYNIECLMEYEMILPKTQVEAAAHRIELIGSYDPEGEGYIRDPYFTNQTRDFERVYQQCYRCCEQFIEKHHG